MAIKPTTGNLADWYWWQVNAPVWATHWNEKDGAWFDSATGHMPDPRFLHSRPEKPATGRKDDSGKPRMSLIPARAEKLLAEVLTFGAEKYGPENWREVDDAGRRYVDAAMRHVNAYRRGEELDEESGKPHLAHAMCCLAFLLELDSD